MKTADRSVDESELNAFKLTCQHFEHDKQNPH